MHRISFGGRLTRTLAVLALAGAANAQFNFSAAGPVNSGGPVGSVDNGILNFNYAGPAFLPGSLTLSGTLNSVIPGTFASEARVRVTNPAGQFWNSLQWTSTGTFTTLTIGPATDLGLLEKWALVREFRGRVTKQLEEVRAAGGIGASLQAELDVYAGGALYDALNSLGDDLRFVLITSRATLHAAAEEKIVVTPSAHQKCERCWHYRADVGADAAHPQICGRCTCNLHGEGEPRSHA